MKKRNNLLTILPLVLFFFSCQKEVDYDDELLAPKLVVNCLLQVDSTCVIYLERTKNFMEDDPDTGIYWGANILIENLTTGTSYSTSMPVDENRYELPFVVEANTDYRLTVTHPDYPTVTATTRTVPIVPLISVDTVSADYLGYPHLQSTWKWQDIAGENYYMVSSTVSAIDTNDFDSEYSVTYIASGDPIADNQQDDPLNAYNSSRFFVFTDETFTNAMKTMLCYNQIYQYMSNYYTDLQIDYNLSSINRDAYLYYRSVQKQSGTDPTFSEPVKVYTNIQNGYGIFACTNHKTITY